MIYHFPIWLVPLLGTAVLFTPESRADWRGFRGSFGDGHSTEGVPALDWSENHNLDWSIPLPGSGNGSPIVAGTRVFVACARDLGRQRSLHCFRAADGLELWSRTVEVGTIELTHKSNPYCGSTAASDGQVVVVWHGTGGLHCYRLDGTAVWSRDFGEIRHLWGYGTSPVLSGDRVVLFSGANSEMFVVACRLEDGATLWRTVEPGGQTNETPDGVMTGSWATPRLIASGNRVLAVCGMPSRVVALDVNDGTPVWSCRGLEGVNGNLVYASPMVGSDSVVVMAGYQGPAIAVRLGGSGDVTETHRLWRTTKGTPQRIGTGVICGDHIYLGNADGGTIQCLELATGRECWRQRVRGGPHWASTVTAGGFVFATNQSGITRVFRPDPTRIELVAENSLPGTINATPAISDGRIYIRTNNRLYCVSDRP